MVDVDNARVRERLEARRLELTETSDTTRESQSVVELDQTRVGRVSRMDALQMQAMAQASDRRRQQEVQRIDAALERLGNGEFGECLTCGDAINPKRLAFDPLVTLCITCATRAETE